MIDQQTIITSPRAKGEPMAEVSKEEVRQTIRGLLNSLSSDVPEPVTADVTVLAIMQLLEAENKRGRLEAYSHVEELLESQPVSGVVKTIELTSQHLAQDLS